MPLVGEANADLVFVERPQLLDQPIVQLMRPFTLKEGNDLLAADDELRAIAPPALRTIGERNLFGVSRVPGVFCCSDLLNSGFESERRNGGGALRLFALS